MGKRADYQSKSDCGITVEKWEQLVACENPVKTWTVTENGNEAKVYDSYSVKSGNTYRVKTTGTVWAGSQSETMYTYSTEKEYT